ncbi:2-deoxyribose-5-phosphate aldolase [Cryobacterium sp. TMT1-62]|uniref:2-deoxyribose-5-phosphate aldolase n=1 Tax=Cryobacterium sp. TMT1-62 TaxID=1259240 RepID=UPI00106D157D|nr:2-deoxyribose-5-phosphate aldolase [Cryobacterium sp. TMT1-62]
MDHTLLTPEATAAELTALIAEAIELSTYSVCVSPSMLPLLIPAGADLKVTVVCGFPSGKHHSSVKAAEAALAIEQGTDEIDMVIDIGAVKPGRFADVQADIAAVRARTPAPKVLKVISVRSFDDARAMIAAGASRLGVSGSAALLSGSTHAVPTGTYWASVPASPNSIGRTGLLAWNRRIVPRAFALHALDKGPTWPPTGSPAFSLIPRRKAPLVRVMLPDRQ